MMLRAPQVKAANAAALNAALKRSAPSDYTQDGCLIPTKRRRSTPAKARPLNFDHLLDRVEKYMTKELPWTAGRSREINEAGRVSFSIEKMMFKIAERCPPDATTLVKTRSMDAMIEIWSIVVFTTGSYTHKGCMRDSSEWEEPFLRVWHSFSQAEKTAYASVPETIENLVEVAMEWKGYCEREEMFDELLQDMKHAARAAVQSQGEEGTTTADNHEDELQTHMGPAVSQYFEMWDNREEERARRLEKMYFSAFPSFSSTGTPNKVSMTNRNGTSVGMGGLTATHLSSPILGVKNSSTVGVASSGIASPAGRAFIDLTED